jgi:type 2 lantibiotic biosynthesis protein LanM
MSSVKTPPSLALGVIAAEASTLWERLRGECEPLRDGASAGLARQRLEAWREKIARGDGQVFEKRLKWLDTTPREVLGVLGNVRPAQRLPDWTRVLESALKIAPGTDAPHSRHPFGKILSPFARVGLDLLAPACHSHFAPEILLSLADDLLRQLSYVAAPTLYLEFSVFRSTRGDAATAATTSDAGTKLFETFSSRMLEGGLQNFFLKYPTLARLLCLTVEQWSHNISELAEALETDMPRIREAFSGGCDAGRVAAVRPSHSDGHNGGRTVALLEFTGGLRLVYKPRDIRVEQKWFALLQFLNERGGDFRVLRVLDCGGHGWVEAARHASCRDEAEARQFYVRAGQLLCLLYALDAFDCFYENIIAAEGYPVLIDMETLMHHTLRYSSDLPQAEAYADEILLDSVLRTGFLPSWEAGPDGACFDMSGLGATPGQATPYLKRRWRDVNTDALELEQEPVRVDSAEHLPHLNGAPLSASAYAEEIVRGFRSLYELLVELRSELSADGGLVDQIGRQETRFVFHATRIYSLLLKRLYAPRYLKGGVERSIQIDFLSRLYLASRQKERYRLILEAELAALERLDIPRFTVFADQVDLALPTGKVLDGAFAETALRRARRKLASLNQSDAEVQARFINASLRAAAVTAGHETGAAAESAHVPGDGESPALTPDELIAEARIIAAEIERESICASDGSVTWIAPQLLPGTVQRALRPLRVDLYDGLAGVALFYAALARVTSEGRDTALAALASVRKFVRATKARRMIDLGYPLGAATGIGSLIYTFTRCASLADEPALLGDALAAAEKISREWIDADAALDVVDGAAGLILGLLALHAETGNSEVLAKAVQCGEHLLGRQEPAGRGAAWRTGRGEFMTGFSHGAAGIALALLRLHGASGREAFRRAAREAIAYEDTFYDEAAHNWPDFRDNREHRPVFRNAWCHGAAGIGLARIAGRPGFDSAEVGRDIDAALKTVSQGATGDKDGLCCGNLGRAELLLAAASTGADTATGSGAVTESRAALVASAVVSRARRAGGYRLSGHAGRDFFDPSFFQGLSGIGYQLLRIARPRALPSVLVWE